MTDTSAANSAYLKGQDNASSSRSAYLIGGVVTKSQSPAFTQGYYVGSSRQYAYTRGATIISSSQAAFMYGGVFEKSSVHAFMAVTGGLKRSSTRAFAFGIIRSSVHAFMEAHVAEYAYIWLKTSDGGATKAKKFRVVAQNYDDGTPEKAETLERTIGGGLNLNMGAIYTTWSPIIRVRHTETETDYGNMADLEYFYNLNNPNGTPSNRISFTDHHGVERTVYMFGQMKKAIMGFKTEGEHAWYTIAVRMIQAQ